MLQNQEQLSRLPVPVRDALGAKGFSNLTPVQSAVLESGSQGDLIISSQTGSGKTVAIGLRLAHYFDASGGNAPRRALLITPTRELALQVRAELSWLLAGLGVRVLCVFGGNSMPGELASLRSAKGATLVVGTPGRLLDHLKRGSIAVDEMRAVILDEADQMLDMGFRDDLDAIFGYLPAERETHMVSATFAKEAMFLAKKYQSSPRRIEGTTHGQANTDIEHVVHLIRSDERVHALINVILTAPSERTLIFVRTRKDASDLQAVLEDEGIACGLLTGDLEQFERTRALNAFRSGAATILVATNVAARGIDIPDVTRIIHADPPSDAETLTHRSGRTGRAGRKGTSIVMVPLDLERRVASLIERARIDVAWKPVPCKADVERATGDRLASELLDPAMWEGGREALAERLLSEMAPATLVARLLERCESRISKPRDVTQLVPQVRQNMKPKGERREKYHGSFVSFHVNWGHRQGADARRLLALICRRGEIGREHIGSIKVLDRMAMVEVAAEMAARFAKAIERPDPRDPRVRISALDPARKTPRAGGGAASQPRNRGSRSSFAN